MSERISGINNPMYGVPSIWKGKKLPDKTRAKISKKAKERKYSEETKAKMSNSHLGEKNSMYNKKHTENTKKKISETRQKYIGENHPMYGKKHSEESKKRISKKASKIKIKQLDKGGNLIKIWSSMTEAYKILSSNGYKISVTTISKCCKGKVKTAGGFCWQYY
jgi:group I intron endonuclease